MSETKPNNKRQKITAVVMIVALVTSLSVIASALMQGDFWITTLLSQTRQDAIEPKQEGILNQTQKSIKVNYIVHDCNELLCFSSVPSDRTVGLNIGDFAKGSNSGSSVMLASEANRWSTSNYAGIDWYFVTGNYSGVTKIAISLARFNETASLSNGIREPIDNFMNITEVRMGEIDKNTFYYSLEHLPSADNMFPGKVERYDNGNYGIFFWAEPETAYGLHIKTQRIVETPEGEKQTVFLYVFDWVSDSNEVLGQIVDRVQIISEQDRVGS